MPALEPIAGPLLKGLGAVLAFFYSVIPSYGVAIVLLTLATRVILLPLSVRGIRAMCRSQAEMALIQPKLQVLRRKYKGNRQKLNEEMMKLYREHNINPLGGLKGCLPLLLQMPVFIALFAVLRATEGAFGVPAEPVSVQAVSGETTVCRPDSTPSPHGGTAAAVVCEDRSGERATYPIDRWLSKNSRQAIPDPPSSLAFCRPQGDEDGEISGFLCESRLGPGHLPEDSALFGSIVEDRAGFLGIELACSPTQALNDVQIRACAGPGTQAGVGQAVPYFLLVALMVFTTWYQQRQMQRASAGPPQPQQQMMARIMPVFLGFISISISAGVLVYWVTTNGWQIGQQHLMLRARTDEPVGTGDGKKPGKAVEPRRPGSGPTGDGGGPRAKRNARGRKKRRKR